MLTPGALLNRLDVGTVNGELGWVVSIVKGFGCCESDR